MSWKIIPICLEQAWHAPSKLSFMCLFTKEPSRSFCESCAQKKTAEGAQISDGLATVALRGHGRDQQRTRYELLRGCFLIEGLAAAMQRPEWKSFSDCGLWGLSDNQRPMGFWVESREASRPRWNGKLTDSARTHILLEVFRQLSNPLASMV